MRKSPSTTKAMLRILLSMPRAREKPLTKAVLAPLSISNTQARPSTINLTRVPKAWPSHSKGLVFTYIGKLPVRWDRYHSRDRDKARSSSAGRSEERRVGKEGRYCGLETSVETNGKL